MSVASIQLCKELYELSGWGDTFNYWEWSDSIPTGEPYLTQPELMKRYGLWSTQEVKSRCAAYDCGYLLRKLPKRIDVHLDLTDDKTRLSAFWGQDEYMSPIIAYTHEDALCKLAIELFKWGVLKETL